MVDIVEVFTRFGAVKSNDWEGPCIAIDLESTEKNAVQCIFLLIRCSGDIDFSTEVGFRYIALSELSVIRVY